MVTGTYDDADSVTDAVRALLGASVPADTIEVRVHRASGGVEDVEVVDEPGVREGAVRGAKIGAVLGALLMGGLAVFVPWSAGDGPFSADPFTAALRGALGGAAAGVMLGGLIGIGRWKGMRGVDRRALRDGTVHVSVRSDALSGKARGILEDTGAKDINDSER